MYVFGDRERFREGCRRATVQDRGNGNGGEGDEGKEEKEREENGWDYDTLPEKVVGMIDRRRLNNWTMCRGSKISPSGRGRNTENISSWVNKKEGGNRVLLGKAAPTS